jgi:hypothetical protein
MEVKDETKAVHFINTNNDPDIFTKTYVLKHADPYELRPYIRSAVKSQRVDTDITKVEAIKYEDGTGILIVSAEDYRFDKQEVGMGIDEIVKTLDMPKISSSSGHKFYLYFPKYWAADALETIIKNVGLNNAHDVNELDQGKDRVTVDNELNALLFYTPLYSIKTVNKMLKLYDTPTSEALIKYTVYELNSENDGTIGMDFQAWKNGPGADLFAAGSRWTNGWDIANMAVNTRPYVRNSYTKYINFSPKWNSKYLDFLVSKSKAKVITTGRLSIMNNTKARIESTTSLASIKDGNSFGSRVNLMEYQRLENAGWDDGSGTAAGNYNNYRIHDVVDYKGNPVELFQSDGQTEVGADIDFMISRSTVGSQTYYFLKVDGGSDAYFFNFAGENIGKEVRCLDAELQRCGRTLIGENAGAAVYTYSWNTQEKWKTDRNFSIQRDVARITGVDKYGFELTMTPSVCEDATTLNVEMVNTNLIGYKDDGSPRTTRSEISTKVMVSNDGQKFVIGGVDKKQLIRSVSKVPWLGSIPVLGYVFTTESEVLKKSQVVAVVECVPVLPNTKLPAEIMNTISGMEKDIDNYGIKAGFIEQNDYGFNQFLLDKNKTRLDPLP